MKTCVTRGRIGLLLLVAFVLLGVVPSVRAQPRPAAPSFAGRCTDPGPVTLPPSGVIPVVVSYMKNAHHPDDNIESKKMSRERIRRGFEPSGEFHRVWGPLGITFAVVGFRVCEYTLGPSQDPDPRNPRHDIPDPGVNFARVFLQVVGDLNTREVQTSAGAVTFRGLDLYLWWLIEGSTPGYGIRPRFGKVNEESGLETESTLGRPGAVWLDTKCVGGTAMTPTDFCAGLFSHEAGHFLGLCHCCFRADQSEEAQRCINYLKPGYCPGLRLAASGSGPACSGDLDQRLMSATNPFTAADNLHVAKCEKDTALAGKEKLLRFGGNGIGSRR